MRWRTDGLMNRKVWLMIGLLAVVLTPAASAQEKFPPVPDDITRIYYSLTGDALIPLSFEPIITGLPIRKDAKVSRSGIVELKGSHAGTVIKDPKQRFYIFVAESMEPPPHFLTRMTVRNDQRRLAAFVEKGQLGFSPLASETIKLEYRVLDRVGVEAGQGLIVYVLYIEVRPQVPLSPGEYAFVGNDFANLSTFTLQ